MSIFTFNDNSYVGTVQAVDTASVVVSVENETVLSNIKVNNLVIINASKERQTLIGMVNKIIRKFNDLIQLEDDEEITTEDIVKINLIGTLLDKDGVDTNVFKRTLESVPEISSNSGVISTSSTNGFSSWMSPTIP